MQEYNKKSEAKTLTDFIYIESGSVLNLIKMVKMAQPPGKSGYATGLNLHSSCPSIVPYPTQFTECSIIQNVESLPIFPGSWKDTQHHFLWLSFASNTYVKSAAGIQVTIPQRWTLW